MTCPECRGDNRPGAKFCDSCGARLPRVCPACGAAVRPTANFCDECGRALGSHGPTAAGAPATITVAEVADRLARKAPTYTPRHLAEKILTSRGALEGERKQVTVLFVDCVGFTSLSSRLDPEDLHSVMDGCFVHLMEAVHRYEGTVNQFTGDGIMALFGAPIAHEDHAVRAVAAAITIQRTQREYAESLSRERGIDFAVRIGLNTGPVVVGKIGDDLRMDYTAQGETVNLASRLQADAPPGGILLSEATHRLVSGYFLTEDCGMRCVKGIDHPVRAWTVTGQRRRRARFEVAIERGLMPLIGRARELAFLRECGERAGSGRGQVVSVVGEAGVGKSRLLHELKREWLEAPLTYVEGHCLPHGPSLPFHVVIQLLQATFRLEEGEPEGEQVEKFEAGVRRLDPALEWTLPYLKHLLALPAAELESEGLDQAQRKRRTIEAVKTFVLRGAQDRPLVVLVEDLQWIDRNSEELCRTLIDGLASHRVLLLGTYRPGYTPPWQDRSSHQRLVLDRLSDEETIEIVTALLDAAELAPALRALVLERTEGNPFFVEELTRYLREQDLLEPRGGTLTLRRAPAPGEVPDTVHDLLTARIDRLSDPLKRTLQVASVLGREFSLSLLQALTPQDPTLTDHLGELVRLELLREKGLFPEPTYSFGHLLIQQVAYQALLLKVRAELHARAGDALERLYAGRLDEALSALADHYAGSGERDKAYHYLMRAGERAASLFAYEEARAYFRRALERTDPAGDAEGRRAAVLEKLADAARAHGDLAAARQEWGDALALVLGRGDRRRVADLHRKIGDACWAAGERDAALAHLEQGLAALGEDAENLEAAGLYQEFGRVCVRLGDHARAMDWAQRARALGERLGAPDVISHAYNTWGVALARNGDIEAGAASVARSLETALAHQLGAVACRAYTNLAVMHATLDHNRSREYCREGLALAQRIGDQLQQSWLYCTLAGGHCTLAGDYDEGVKAAEAAVELDQRLGQRNHLPIPLIILAQIHQCRGDGDRSAHYYREALAVAREVGEPQLLFPCYEGLATLAIERGDDAGAEEWLSQSRRVQQATGWDSDSFLVLPFLC
ncbi:MAG: guanylate cyclase [Candidatus Rokuibacteriota bacterium]|nr:MAG: guanylate cyclase [Candidatus Rokubacteria bacterium]